MSIIDASSGYHNLKLGEKVLYQTAFTCWYWYRLLLFGAAPAGSMFQWKIDEIFSNMSNVMASGMTFWIQDMMRMEQIMMQQCTRCYKDAKKLT